MMNVARTLNAYWSSFGIDAYVEENVPDDAELPYITYELKQPEWRGTVPYAVRVWWVDTSYSGILSICDKIANDIGEGKRLVTEGGTIYLFKDTNFMQFQPVENDGNMPLKVAYLQMVMHVLA